MTHYSFPTTQTDLCDDDISLALHNALVHLEQKDFHVRPLF